MSVGFANLSVKATSVDGDMTRRCTVSNGDVDSAEVRWKTVDARPNAVGGRQLDAFNAKSHWRVTKYSPDERQRRMSGLVDINLSIFKSVL